MVDISLMRGVDWVRCTICGELHTSPYENLAQDQDGVYWDVCKGDCAKDAGIAENTSPIMRTLLSGGIMEEEVIEVKTVVGEGLGHQFAEEAGGFVVGFFAAKAFKFAYKAGLAYVRAKKAA